MATIMTSNLMPGMKVSQDIINKNGVKLLSKNTILSKYIIEYLGEWGVKTIHIEEDEIETVYIRREKQEQISKSYSNALSKVENFMEGLKGSSILKLDQIRETVTEIQDFTETSAMLHIMNTIKDKDKYTYQHSVNVAIYSSFIGK